MAFGTWEDNRADWFDKTPLIDACPKLDDFTKNSHALVKQETFANWGGLEFDPLISVTWGIRGYMALTLYGNEPYDKLMFMLYIACTELDWPLMIYMNVWFRIYNVERDEYYPNSSGIQMYPRPAWITPFPYPGRYFQTLLIEADLTPPAGAWSAQSYELQLQSKYTPTATQRISMMRGMIAIMERS